MEEQLKERMLLLHEAEITSLKSDLRDLGQIVEAVAHVVASIGERIPGETTELAERVRSLLFEQSQRAQQRAELYFRGMKPPLGGGT